MFVRFKQLTSTELRRFLLFFGDFSREFDDVTSGAGSIDPGAITVTSFPVARALV